MSILSKKPELKFCPICGNPAAITDAYCMRCGHSFKQSKIKKRKSKGLLIVIVVLIILYFGLRYLSNQPIIPLSIPDALNISIFP